MFLLLRIIVYNRIKRKHCVLIRHTYIKKLFHIEMHLLISILITAYNIHYQ